MLFKKITIITSALAIFFLVAGCQSTKPVIASASGGSEMLFMHQWNLTELKGKTVVITAGIQPNLLFSPGQMSRVSGSTGCNKLNGSFVLSAANSMKFSPLATTKMACVGDNVESKFLEVLGQVGNWAIINNQLLLKKGKVIMAKLNAVTAEAATLNGTWELNYISGPRIAFNALYPDEKPQIKFSLTENELGGNTSCNGFSSKITIDGTQISIAEPFAKTMIFCEGGGETTFLNMLKKVNRYAVSDGNTLAFIIGDAAVMRFTRK